MAHIHGDAARYPAAQAFKTYLRTPVFMVWFVGLTGFIGGVSFMASLSRMWWVVGVCFLILFWGIRRWEWAFDRYTREDRKERRKYLRGADAEAVVALELSDLGDEYHVFNSLELDGSSDMDHVVVGPSGLWCVSTKANKGVYEVGPGKHVLNGEVTDFGSAAVRDGMRLRESISPDIAGKAPFAQAVVVLPFAWIEGEGMKCNPAVVGTDGLTELVAADRPRQKMSVKEIGQTVEALKKLSVRRSVAKVG